MLFRSHYAIMQQDGYTAEVTGPEAVHMLVATYAKPNQNNDSTLNRQFYRSFLDVSFPVFLFVHKFLNFIQGRFVILCLKQINILTQFPRSDIYLYHEVLSCSHNSLKLSYILRRGIC